MDVQQKDGWITTLDRWEVTGTGNARRKFERGISLAIENMQVLHFNFIGRGLLPLYNATLATTGENHVRSFCSKGVEQLLIWEESRYCIW